MMRCFFSDWCVWFFVKYLQDGFTKYKRTRLHDDALLFFSDWCVWFFVKYLQDGFTKYKRTRGHDDALLYFGLVRLVLCKIFASSATCNYEIC